MLKRISALAVAALLVVVSYVVAEDVTTRGAAQGTRIVQGTAAVVSNSAPISQPTGASPLGPGPTVAAVQSTAPPLDAQAARANFDKQFAEWKVFLAQFRTLRDEFTATNPQQQPALVERYLLLLREGQTRMASLAEAAIVAYESQTGNDPELTEFLALAVQNEARRDNFELAARGARLLVDRGEKSPMLIDIATQASLIIGDLDAAEKYAKLWPGNQSYPGAKELAQRLPAAKAAWQRERTLRAAEAKANDLPRVKLQTEYGDVILELFENEAPNTVANFISLVEKGYYNGLTFHRILPGYMAQAGCPKGDGTGGPGYAIRGEAKDAKVYRQHLRGSLSMATEDKKPDSGGSQFFIAFVARPELDGKHTVFGRVIEGMPILSRLHRDPPTRIVKATVIRKRDHKYDPQTIPAAARSSRS